MLKTKVLLILVLLLTATAGAWADGDVASRTTTGDTPEVINYESLAAAIAAAQDGDVITMLANETTTEGLTINNSITLDLKGKTLEYTGTSGTALTISANKSVIIQDNGTGQTPGGIRCTAGGWVISNNGTLTINSGSFTATNALAISNNGTLTVNGGTISGTGGIKNNYPNKPKLTVTGGSITATGGNTWSVISISQDGTFNLSGNPTLTATYKATDIFLAEGKVINIPADLTAPGTSPDNAWTVEINNDLPYTFTGNWPSTMSTADPALFFKSIAANVTTRFVDGTEGLKKAQFILPQATLTAAPKAKTGLEYTGGAQDLITAGTATGGTLYYGLGTSEAAPTEESAWSEIVPKEIEHGMYYVWYKVVGDGSHTDIAPTGPLEVTIAKATPHIDTDPVAGDIMAGQTLENSTLNGGYAMNPNTSQPVSGSFAWANPNTVPSISDSQRTEYDVTFTPSNTNYNTATTKITLKVNAPVVSRTNGTETHNYMTLEEALTAANDGETITLIGITPEKGCVELASPVTIDKSVILDLNGFMLFYEGTGDTPALTISSGKTVTIKDSGTDGSISTNVPTAIKNNGELLITGGTITGSDGIFNNGTMTVTGGTITGNDGIVNMFDNPVLNVSGGTITATASDGSAISIQTGTFNLSGNPTITGGHANISLADGKVINITGALTELSTAWKVISQNISNAPATPYTFTSGWSDKMGTADPAAYFACTTAGITTCLTRGGEAEFIIPKATITTAGENPTILNYATLADALADANNGETITLLDNVDLGTTGIEIDKNVTLDLKGKTLSYSGTGNALTISGAEVTITGTEGNTPGGITCTANGMAILNDGGRLTISGGAFSSTNTTIHNQGRLTVSGGTITCGGGNDNISGIINQGDLTIDGGTITCSGGHDNISGISNQAKLTFSGGTITCNTTGNNVNGIQSNDGSLLTVSGGSISSTGNGSSYAIDIYSGAMFNLSGGSISSTGNGSSYAIDIYRGATFYLSGAPTISGTTADIYLAAAIVISAAPTPPANPWTVEMNNYQNPLTAGYGSKCKDDNNNVIDPAKYFTYYDDTKGLTIRYNRNWGEAQFVRYTPLADATKPTIINDGQDGDGTRDASTSGDFWVGDVLHSTTTAIPVDGITWQWYRVNSDGETAIPGATTASTNTDGDACSEYTLTAEDVGYTIIAKATMAANAAGTDHPGSDITVASAATAVVEKKDNFGELANIAPPMMDYIGMKIIPVAGVQYLVVADGVTPTAAQWALATTSTGAEAAAGILTITQFAAVSGETVSLSQMMPGTEYDLYYRLVETEDTKAGNTDETDGKPVNEKNTDITTLDWNYQITTGGVTYELSHPYSSETPTTAKVVAIPGVAAETESAHEGHIEATILASIPADNPQLLADLDVWKDLGYVASDATTFANDIAVDAAQTDYTTIDLGAIGASADNYGYIQADAAAVYTALAGGTVQEAITVEGYKIYSLNNGYYALKNGEAGYDMVIKDKTVAESGMTAILNAAGMTGGSVTFYDKAGVALPAGTGDDADKFMAAAGQKVVVEVTLPTGYEFKSGTSNQQLTVTGSDENRIIQLTQVGTSNVWTAEFPMPSEDVTVSFKNIAPIQGKTIAYDYSAPATDAATVTADAGNPYPVRVNQPLVYTIEPLKVSGKYYALTDLGLTDGVMYTIVDFANESETVTLPTEKKVKVTLTVPVTFTGDEITFAPVMAACAEDIAVAANSMTTYFDTKALAVPSTNTAVTLFTVESVSGTTVTLSEITSKQVPAHTPFIIKNESDATTLRMDYPAGEVAALTVADEFRGTAVSTNPFGGTAYDYYGFNGTNFVWLKASGSDFVAPHRCWLTIAKSSTSGARQLTLVWPDGETASLSEKVIVNSEEFATAEWYTLDGRKLQAKPQRKGVYIQNGQKVVIR